MLHLKKILLATDFSDIAEAALRYTLFLARHNAAEVHLAHVEEAASHYLEEDKRLQEKVEERMAALTASMDLGDVRVERVILRGEDVAPALTAYADKISADLTVIGTHGHRGLRRLVMGSVAEEVVRKAKGPVLTVRKHEGIPPEPQVRRILLPLDFSESSLRAVPYAKDLAARYGADLVALHVFDNVDLPGFYGDIQSPLPHAFPEVEARVRENLRTAIDEAEGPDVRAEYVAGRGSAPEAIVDEAERREADLIVIASHGRSGVERLLLGSVSEHVLRAAPCPVLLVRVGEE